MWWPGCRWRAVVPALDIDIMVPRDQLERIEKHLVAHGWEPVQARCLRQAILPKMEPRAAAPAPPRARHRARRPPYDPAAAVAAASGPCRVLARGDYPPGWFASALPDPHGAACGGPFVPGRGDRGRARRPRRFRRAVPAFWPGIATFGGSWCLHAVELGLVRPLYYALHYASELLGTTVPEPVMAEASRVGRPPTPVHAAMDPMVRRALLPDLFGSRTPWWRVARLCLYIRSHWLRMPPVPLARHLLRKAWLRRVTAAS